MQACPTLRLWGHCFGVHPNVIFESLPGDSNMSNMSNKSQQRLRFTSLTGDCLGGSDLASVPLAMKQPSLKSSGEKKAQNSQI